MEPQHQSDQPQTLGITVATIKAICLQTATNTSVRIELSRVGYQPTEKQTFFFVLVWLVKKLLKKQGFVHLAHNADLGQWIDAAEVQQRAQLVIQFLREWGAAVTELKQRDDKRWALLRIQMAKALKSFECPVEIKDDAVQNAYIKIYQMLEKMPDGAVLEAAVDLVSFVVQHQAIFKGIYDFGVPIYGYAGRAARNQLVNLLGQIAAEPVDKDGLDGVNEIQIDDGELEVEEPYLYPKTLEKSLKRLFSLIQTQLTPMPAKVIWHTLAARAQFWLALTITELKSPIALMPTPKATDSDIANQLDISENDVRVHRNHAKKTIHKINPKAGELLEVLLDRHLSKHLKD